MYKNMTYQQARRIRNQSISSVLADQLIMGAGYGAAIRQTASAKFNAKLSGIKEKFDPLNIAKFLTGGSRLGPAILGKMLGRSRKDIEYFTGTARPIQYRGPKVSAVPSMGGGDTSGMSSVLGDILTFLQKSHEQDMILREKENNLREGQKHEDERRHQAFLKALGGVSATPVATASKVKPEGNSLFDNILKMVQDMIAEVKKAFEWISDLKWLTNVAGWARTAFTALSAEAFLTALPLAAFIAPFMMSAAEKEKIRENPTAPQYKDNPYAMAIRNEASSEGQAAEINTRATTKQFRRRDVVEFVGSAMSDAELTQELGADRKSLQAWLNSHTDKGAMWQAPVAKLAGTEYGEKKVGTVENSNYYGEKNHVPKTPEAQTAAEAKVTATVAATPPEAVPTTPVSAAVSAKTNENLTLGLEAKVVPKTETTNSTNVMNSSKTEKRKFVMPSVRNTEETFQRLIYNSTRVV